MQALRQLRAWRATRSQRPFQWDVNAPIFKPETKRVVVNTNGNEAIYDQIGTTWKLVELWIHRDNLKQEGNHFYTHLSGGKVYRFYPVDKNKYLCATKEPMPKPKSVKRDSDFIHVVL